MLVVLLGPLVYRSASTTSTSRRGWRSPSWKHPLGTDDLGRDLLARVLYGGRISLAVGMAAMLIAITVGVIIGAIAGISRGWLDAALMWVTDLFLSLPQLPLLLLLIFLFRESLKQMFGLEVGIFLLIVVVIGGFRWMPVARLVRAQFFSLREKEFVEAARALGASTAARGGAPHPAQRAGAGDRGRHHRRAGRHHRREHAQLPGPGLPAGHPHLGPHPLRRARLHGPGAVTGCCSRAWRSSSPC